MAHEIPYYLGLRDYLEKVREEFYILGKKKQSNELNLPDAVSTNQKTIYGTPARKKPITHSQQMALITEMLDVVMNNMDKMVYKTKKAEYEKEISELDRYYTEKIDYLKTEVEEAEKIEQEMRNRYISAYEKYTELELNNKDIKKEELDKYFPLDEFKAAWTQASQKLCKVTNQKVAAESAYLSKTQELIKKYKENEEALRTNTTSINYANEAWNYLIATINTIKSNDVVREYTEDDLDTEPKKGEMSKYDEWRIQKDIETLDSIVQNIQSNYEYNQQFNSIKAVNEKLYGFEIDIADHFDDEYENLDLEDVDEQQGIISQLQSEDMIKAADYKKELETLAEKVYRAKTDVQKQDASKRDDYGVIIRDIKEKNTELYNKLIAEKEQIQANIKKYGQQSELNEKKLKQEIEDKQKATEDTVKLYVANITENQNYIKEDLQLKYDAIDKKIKEWKDPEPQAHTYSDEQLADADEQIRLASEDINRNNQAIFDKQREINKQQEYINVELEKIANNNKLALQQTINTLQGVEQEYNDFKNKFDDFEKERTGELSEDFSNEFSEDNLNNWVEEYLKLTPEDSEKEITKMFNASYEQSKEIGMQLAEQRYNVGKLNDDFVALSAFRKAAEEENYKNDKDYQAAEKEVDKQAGKKLREEYDKKVQGLEEEYLENTQFYRDELDRLSKRKTSDSLAEDLDKIAPDEFDGSDDLAEEKEIYEKTLPEWKALVLRQEKERLERQYYIEDRKASIESEYQKARMDAAMKVSKLNKKAEELTLHIDQKIKDLRSHYSPADLTVFDNAIEARNKLFDQLEIESKKFAKEQEQEAEDFEIELQNKLDDMDKTLLWDIEKAENEYKQAEIESGKRLANAFVDIKSTSILSQLLQKRASLKDHKASLPKDEFERALPKYEGIINEIKTLEKEIKDLETQKAELKILSSDEKDKLYKKEEKELLEKRAETAKKIADLKKNHPKLKDEYEKKARADFEKKQDTAYDNFYADQDNQIAREDEKNLNEATRPLMDQFMDVMREEEDGNQKIKEEIDSVNDKPLQDRTAAETDLYNKSIDKLEEQQEQERRKFFEEHQIDSDHVSVLSALDSYQKTCSEETSKHLYTFDLDQKKQEYRSKIQMYKDEHDEALEQLKSQLDIDLQSIDINKTYNFGKNINVARNTTDNNLKYNLQRLSQLNAEKIITPNRIKFLERELNNVKEEYNLAQQQLDDVAEKSYENVIKETDIVNDYRDKYREYPDEILNGIILSQSARAIQDILQEDIDSWLKENIDISGLDEEARKDPAKIDEFLSYASESGMNVYDRIDAESDEAIAHNEYSTPEEKQYAKTKAFFTAERKVLSQIGTELRKHYSLYSKLRDVRQAYIDLLGMSEQVLGEFNDSLSVLTIKELAALKESQKNEKHAVIEHIDPSSFKAKLNNDIYGYEQVIQGQIKAYYLNKKTKDNLDKQTDKETERRAEYDNKLKALNDSIDASLNRVNAIKHNLDNSSKIADEAKAELDNVQKDVLAADQNLERHNKDIEGYNHRAAEIDKQISIIDKKLEELNRPITKDDPIVKSAAKAVNEIFDSSVKLKKILVQAGKLPDNAEARITPKTRNDLAGDIYKDYKKAFPVIYEDPKHLPQGITEGQKSLKKKVNGLEAGIKKAKDNLKALEDKKKKSTKPDLKLEGKIHSQTEALKKLEKQYDDETRRITSAAVNKINGLSKSNTKLENLVERLGIKPEQTSKQTAVTKEQVDKLIDMLPDNYPLAMALAAGDDLDKPTLNIKGPNPEIEKQNKEREKLLSEKNDITEAKRLAEQERGSALTKKNEVLALQQSKQQIFNEKNNIVLQNKDALSKAEKEYNKLQLERNKLGEYVAAKIDFSSADRDKIEAQAAKETAKLFKALKSHKAFNLIGKIYKEKHKRYTSVGTEESELNVKEARIEQLTKELDDLKQSQISNEKDVMDCNVNIAALTADKAKYELYEKGLGEEYDNVKKDLDKAEKDLKDLEAKQQDLINPQQQDQKLKNELDKQDTDPFAKKNNLFKKRRLMDLTVKRLSSTLEQNEVALKTLEEEEKALFEKYKQLDQYGTVLDGLSAIDSPDKLQKAENDLIEKEKLNREKTERNLAVINRTEAAIEVLGNAEYMDDKALQQGRAALEQKNADLSGLYAEKRTLEDEVKTFPIIKAAHNVIAARQKRLAQQLVVIENKANLTKAQLSAKVVDNDILNLQNDLSKMLKAKSETLETRKKSSEKAMKDAETAFTTTKDAAEKKLNDLNEELAGLNNKSPKLTQTLEERNNIKNSYLEANNEIDKKNQEEKELKGVGGTWYKQEEEKLKEANQNIKDKKDEIDKYQTMTSDVQNKLVSFVQEKEGEIKQSKEKYNKLIATEKGKIQPNEDAIEKEKKNMRQTMLNEYKLIGEKALKVDKFNKLSRQREKIESFQRDKVDNIVNAYPEDEIRISEEAIAKTNRELNTKMTALVTASKKVKKWYAKNSTDFTHMIDAVKFCADLEKNGGTVAAPGLLQDAIDKANNYIRVRSADKIQTGSLLRKSRLALANDILRTCRLMKEQYEQLVKDQHLNQKDIDDYNENKRRVQELKASQKGSENIFQKFCRLFIKPLLKSKDKKYDTYRQRDAQFKQYIETIHTKEWDKVVQEQKFNEVSREDEKKNAPVKDPEIKVNYQSPDMKEKYQLKFDKDLKIMRDEQNTQGNFSMPMISEMEKYGLAHIVKKDDSSEGLLFHRFEIEDQHKYDSVNAGIEKLNVDNTITEEIKQKSFKLVVEPKNKKISNEALQNDSILNKIVNGEHESKVNALQENIENKQISLDNELPGFNPSNIQPKENSQPDSKNLVQDKSLDKDSLTK